MQVVNILYYMSVLFICLHYANEDTLARFLRELRDLLKRHADVIHRPKQKETRISPPVLSSLAQSDTAGGTMIKQQR